MKYSKEEQAKAREYLLEAVKPGDTLETILRQVSRSGMSRHISVILPSETGNRDITYLVARLLGDRINDRDGGIVSGGCGMDMGFELVYRLSSTLWPDGFGIVGEASLYPQGIRPASKEQAYKLRSQGVKFCGRNGDSSGWDNDGGYALKQRWL